MAQSTIKHPEKLFIDGKWTDPSGASKIDVINSATEELFATVAEAQAPDVNRTVAAARRAFDHGPWPRMSHGERAEYMRALAMELDTLADKHAQIWTTESGVLHSLSKARMSGLSPTYSSYADMAETYQFQERHTPRNGAHVALVVREPVCVVAAIVPWNGAPVVAGCTIILKASPEAPGSAYILAEAWGASASNSARMIALGNKSARVTPRLVHTSTSSYVPGCASWATRHRLANTLMPSHTYVRSSASA